MDSKKGNVKIRRKIGCPQIIEKIASSGRNREGLRVFRTIGRVSSAA